ncbi:MAG TPA: serine/threonine-protein kinase PknK, partial [Polyangiaceae bacterium]|nr:serine/threonine-protein kinase PknK [Polyangiaceae bacterium]
MLVTGYQLGAEIVHTEHTAVHRAVRERDQLPVIIKALSREYPSPAEVRRMEFEHRILCKLRGPGVVQVLDLVKAGRGMALVLEDFGAESLASESLPLQLADFLHIATQIVTALGRVHALQVIHKDLKPHNLLVSAGQREVKLIDFQVASEISRERQDVSVTNHLEGSLPYISPEQTGRMNRSLDYRSDYYSLGVAFFELLTGKLPFQASDIMGWVHCHISKSPPSVRELNPSVPAALSALVAKLMAKEPRDRYQSSRGLLADLERIRAALDAGQSDAEIVLGQDDISERFGLSQQLVGRESEVSRLVQIFERASRGPGQLLLVSGYSGIGKSSLIRELHKPITGALGYFVSGKFDQLDRSLPYAALLQAVRGLLRQLLAESDQRIQDWRQRLLGALGSGAAVLAEVLPELTQVIGPQAPAPELDPQGAQNRFKFVFAQFIQAVASVRHPLVIFLDDLQWADSSTLELMGDLFAGRDVRHTLIIGAYRDNEVDDSHLLRSTLRQIKNRAPAALSELRLEPLDEGATLQLISRSLKCSVEVCAPLGAVVQAKTQGNPFFTSELLTRLYRDGLLTFASAEGRWTWDLPAVRGLGATDNVVELMVHRLEAFDPGSLSALQVGACIGNVFSLATLSSLLQRSPDATAHLLWQPIQDGMIVPLDDDYRLLSSDATESTGGGIDVSYRFSHDRVQQAAYSLIAESERSAMHLRIGRRLQSQPVDQERPAELFAITNHLNLGCALISELGEREALAQLNRQAGAKAMAATAFGVAAKYHDSGVACLRPAEWQERRELAFGICSERVRSVLMSGQRERAAQLCDELFQYAEGPTERGRVYLQKCEILAYEGRFAEAVSAVREGLALFGIDFPADPDAINQGIGAGIGKMQGHLARVSIAGLATLPDLKDPERQVAMQLLFQVVPPAIMTYPPLFILAELLMFDLALCHGISPVSAKNFVDCGMIQGAVLGDYASAYR